ncbi:ABC transporter ATP-binding protein [Shewanella sp. NIFS-20-20]|uniref:ABC transporter ATP-binding protein n=1 Tax=Shewanella sp. NIFS-20-20 TaxID=2853806 RepID=UPI001C47B17B|nr:ABC transporter ATP-binding protein [Shewanella sp. NIFS-20-20]MBV7314749.1 ABC transporter ATP-binding protein [Shewanella sp. NIFS-20-20]
MASVEVTQLCWQPHERALLDNISFALPTGQMLGVIGPNGAGKSSLLRCLYRYICPTSGSIALDGKDVARLSSKDFACKVAVVQQDTPVELDMTVEQLVALGLTPRKGWFATINANDKGQIAEVLERVGITELASRPYHAISGGEKQRALIARALLQQPQLLILDEPTNHLDIRYQIQIMELVHSLDMTVIASIHDLNLASALCDQLLMLDHGQVVAMGEPSEVLTEARIADVFGVCCQLVAHPQHQRPVIQYFYGYQGGHLPEGEY